MSGLDESEHIGAASHSPATQLCSSLSMAFCLIFANTCLGSCGAKPAASVDSATKEVIPTASSLLLIPAIESAIARRCNLAEEGRWEGRAAEKGTSAQDPSNAMRVDDTKVEDTEAGLNAGIRMLKVRRTL